MKMTNPDDIALALVASFPGDKYWIDTKAAALAIADALREHGAACAAQERRNLLKIAQDTVIEITNTTVVYGHDPGYDGGKRVGASDVYSALLNADAFCSA
jgi:hypothetical protein